MNNHRATASRAAPPFSMAGKEGELDHRKNLDRLKDLIRRSQNTEDNENSACSKIFKYI